MDIALISGALTTPKLWHQQEKLFSQVQCVHGGSIQSLIPQ